jgi:transposase
VVRLKNHSKEAQKEVLGMSHVEYIKDLYENEEASLREIARRTKHHFVTVRKYAYQTDWNQETQPPTRPKEFIAMRGFTQTVDGWLEQDKKEPRKQRHTIKRVFERLQKEHGYTGSYNSVKRYFNYKKEEMKKYRESFLPLAHPPGHAQVDFGDFKYYDGNGTGHEGHALIVSFPHANTGWMQVFPSENQECLLVGLRRIFYHIGGVPVRCRMDNMTTAVAQVLKGTERVISDGFYRFMLHHRFAADFCNPAKGNEKGSVENKVGYTRRNMLVPVPTITDFEAFNAELLQRCDEDHAREHYVHGVSIAELWGEDKKALLSLPEHEYEVFRYEALPVNKNGFVTVDTGKYGLSPEFYDKVVQAKIYFDKIEVFYDHCLLKTFRRSYEKNSEDCDWKDYLPSLVKKPGATEHTRFFNQMPKLWQSHLKSVTGKERKSALLLLSEIVGEGNEILCDDALELAQQYGKTDIDSIRQCYLLISKPENHPQPLRLSTTPPLLNYSPDLSVYDRLKTGGAAQ